MAAAWIAKRGGGDTAAIGSAIGMTMPAARAATTDGDGVMMSVAPETWLAFRFDAPPGWGRDLERRLAGLASVSDQSGAYRLFHFDGAGARTLLQRGVAIDLHDAAFPTGSVAVTAIAHIDVIVRCLTAGHAYEVAIYRSYAESFARWLDAAQASL